MRKIITKTNPKSFEKKPHTIFANIPMRKQIQADGHFYALQEHYNPTHSKDSKTKSRSAIPPHREDNGA